MIGTFGEVPVMVGIGQPTFQTTFQRSHQRSRDGAKYVVVYDMKDFNLPYVVTANLEAGWIAGELRAFLWRIIGLVLLITSFVTIATMAVIGHFVLSPLLQLRDHLQRAAADPENPRPLPWAAPGGMNWVRSCNSLIISCTRFPARRNPPANARRPWSRMAPTPSLRWSPTAALSTPTGWAWPCRRWFILIN